MSAEVRFPGSPPIHRVAPHDDRAPGPEERDSRLLTLVTGLSVVASIIGRALAPALPGSVAGITGWIKAFDRVSGFLAQLFAIAGILMATRMVGSALRSSAHDLLFKVVAVPVTILVGFLVMMRMRIDYSEPRGSLALALASGALALAASPRLVQAPRTRAVGLVLALTGLGSLLHAIGQGLALQANLEALPDRFVAARVVETAGFALGVLAAACAAVWLFGKGRASLMKLLAALVGAALFSHAAVLGSDPDAHLYEVLASRSLGYLLRQPAPYLPSAFVAIVVLFQFILAVWLVVARRPSSSRLVLSLCLISTGATDIPLLGLALTLAALMARAPLVTEATSRERQPSSTPPGALRRAAP